MTIDSLVSCMSTHFNCLYIREDAVTESEEMSVIYRSVHVAIQLQLQKFNVLEISFITTFLMLALCTYIIFNFFLAKIQSDIKNNSIWKFRVRGTFSVSLSGMCV